MIEFADAAMSLMGVLAVQRDRAVKLACRAEVLDEAGVRRLCAASWEALSGDAVEDNPWLSRQMVLAGLDAFGTDRNFRALALYHRGCDTLIGFVPFTVTGVGWLGIGRVALNLYQVGGTPLLAREHGQLAMAGLLGALAGKGMPRHWVFAHVHCDGRFAALARETGGRMGMELAFAAPYRRPVLTRQAGDFAAHVSQVIGKKRAKDIERNLRRLQKLGEIGFERVTAPDAVAKRVEDFLKIEAAGWKGRRGTALLSSRRDADFARMAFGGAGAALGLASVDCLLLDGEPIAVSINISRGETLFTPKCAFDERYRTFGPGMVLEYKVIERFFADGAHREMDSATTVDGHVISGLWGQTKPMGTLVVGPEGLSTRSVCAAVDAAARGRAALKRVVKRG